MMTKPNATIKDLTLDTANINSHSKRGVDLTNRSIDKFKARGAGILDKHSNVVDANSRTELYADKGINDIMIIDADPNVPVYLRYNDLDLHDSDNQARELQLALHRTQKESWRENPEMLAIHVLEKEDIATDWYFPDELEELLEPLDVDIDLGDDVGQSDSVCSKCGRSL